MDPLKSYLKCIVNRMSGPLVVEVDSDGDVWLDIGENAIRVYLTRAQAITLAQNIFTVLTQEVAAVAVAPSVEQVKP